MIYLTDLDYTEVSGLGHNLAEVKIFGVQGRVRFTIIHIFIEVSDLNSSSL